MTSHNGLLKAGFDFRLTEDLPAPFCELFSRKDNYQKKYKTTSGDFSVLLSVDCGDLSSLPLAFVLDRPDSLNGQLLPHISVGNNICYVNEDMSDWNPHNPQATAVAVDQQIQRTLEIAVSKDYARDNGFRTEFVNYWDADEIGYIFGGQGCIKSNDFNSQLVAYQGGTQGAEVKEYIVYEEAIQLENWLSLRGAKIVGSPFETVCIKIQALKVAPSIWPLNSLSDLFVWLKTTDIAARNELAIQLISGGSKTNHFVLLDIKDEGMVAVKVRLNQRLGKTFPKIASNHTKIKRSIKPSHFISALESKKSSIEFSRVRMSSISDDSLLKRNRPVEFDLRNKRIAIIGCGTIGGYCVEPLVRSGAGRGTKGLIDLWDSDEYKPDNYGRHVLPEKYFGWNKATALKNRVEADSLKGLNIRAHAQKSSVDQLIKMKYDIVIDVTGRPPFSKTLSRKVREVANPPIVIFGYNHAYGQVSAVFVDTGKACYGCLDRLSVLNEKDIPGSPESYSCGSVYLPYDASVSIITAALIQEAALNTQLERLPWTYSQHTTGKAIHHKRQNLKPFKSCLLMEHNL
ncbi:MAG: E2/UBC family protein [Colwellia sp.]|jgi:Dinucleotide-utilizing enzymes involved in molybdopterin and thiamine biosynthesis family 1